MFLRHSNRLWRKIKPLLHIFFQRKLQIFVYTYLQWAPTIATKGECNIGGHWGKGAHVGGAYLRLGNYNNVKYILQSSLRSTNCFFFCKVKGISAYQNINWTLSFPATKKNLHIKDPQFFLFLGNKQFYVVYFR